MNRYLEDATDDPSEKPRGASVTAALKTRIEKEKKEIYYLPRGEEISAQCQALDDAPVRLDT